MHSRVEKEAEYVRSELQSANTQASIVLAGVAITIGMFAGRAGDLVRGPWWVTTLAGAGGGTVAGAVWMLLDVALPRLDASGRGSFQTWAGCDREQLRAALDADYQLDELRVLSRIAVAKYRGIRRAGMLLKAGTVLLVAAAVLDAL